MLQRKNDIPANIINIIKMSNNSFEVYNTIQHIFDRPGNSKEFVHSNIGYGFNEINFAYLFLNQTIFTFQNNFEFYKNVWLGILKKEKGITNKMTAGGLIEKLCFFSPAYGNIIKSELNRDLRNAFAHNLYWIDGVVIYYCTNSELITPKTLRIDGLWTEVKNTNVIAQCFLKVVAEKMANNFFN